MRCNAYNFVQHLMAKTRKATQRHIRQLSGALIGALGGSLCKGDI